jgi:hypothetical protein
MKLGCDGRLSLLIYGGMSGLRLPQLHLVLDAALAGCTTSFIWLVKADPISLYADGILYRFMNGIGLWILRRWATDSNHMGRYGTMNLF